MRIRTSITLTLLLTLSAAGGEPRHAVVFHDPETFAAWPANGGLWVWDGGKEALVAFVTGPYRERGGHNLIEPYTNRLARTLDGGKTWKPEPGTGFYQPDAKLKPLPKAIDFGARDFAMRVVSDGYHGGGPEKGAIGISLDRGKTWDGPFSLPDILPAKESLGRDRVTARTDYLIFSPNECLLMASARSSDRTGPDRSFAAKLLDGGKRGEFLSWIQPPDEKHRTMMSSTIRTQSGRFVTTLRVRQADGEDCWVDAYDSSDSGTSWRHLGRVGDTGKQNGNPPALAELSDGRLCCAYGDRTRQKLYARLSSDGGKTWGDEIVVRDGYQPDSRGEVDFGYPRLFQNPDGDLVTVYYFATPGKRTNFIAATIWTLPTRK